MTNYENFNNSARSFRIYCDKLTSNDTSNNLRLTSSNKNIELKVVDGKKIVFKNDVMFNNGLMDLNNKPLTGLVTISAESLNLVSILKKSSVNIVNKSQFSDTSDDGNNTFLTYTNTLQDLSKSFFNHIEIVNSSSVIVDLNVTLYCSNALNERITVELWRDASMLVQSKDLGSVIAAGGMPIPYNMTYLDENLTEGTKKYYIKYKLENSTSSNNNYELSGQGIINITTTESIKPGYASIILTELTNNSNHSNKIIFDNSNLVTTSNEIQDLSALFYNTIDVFNSNVQVNINANLLCCYGINERLNIEVWRDASMIAQSNNLGTINTTDGLTIPYSFNYLDTNLSNGPKKYYLKYKLEKNSTQKQGIVNLSTLNSIGTSNILLRNVPIINANLLINNNNNNNNSNNSNNNNNNNNTSFLTTSAEIQDLSGQLFNNIELDNTSAVIVDLNITLFCCYAANERITVQLWRDLSMVSENINIGNSIATSGLTINYKLSLLDERVGAGIVKYYLKYKLESNLSGQPQGIVNVTGGYNIIEQSNIASNISTSYKVLSYTSMDYTNVAGYIKNTKIGYNPIIEGDKGSSSGRRDAYFSYIDVAGSNSHFNDSLYVKKNIVVDEHTSITSDLSVNGISLATMFDKLSIVEAYSSSIINEFSNNRIKARDLSASNITISNELYVLNKYYANDLNIRGQLLSDVLRVPHEFTIDPSEFFNNNGSLVVNGNLIVRGNKKTIKSSIIDISAFSIKIANNLRNRADLSNNPAGFDVSYIAALHYDGTMWNVSGGNLLVNNMSVGLDVSLIHLQTTISNSLIASKLKYDSSFALLQSNIDNSFANLYTISQLDNSYVTISYSNTKVSDLKNYIDLSFVTKQVFSISGQYIVQNYVTKAYVDGSFSALNNRLDLSFVLKKNVELSYNDLSGQIISLFARAAASDVDISTITIETIKTPKLALTSHVLINGDLIVGGDTSCNSLNISNTFTFSNNGYSSIYRLSSNPETIIEEYYSKFNNFGNFRKVLYILADGSLYYQTGKGAISDSRLKENIVDASPKLEDLLKVRIVDYNLKNNSHKKYIGVVAQELEQLFPSLVSEDYVNANAVTKYKSVKYSCFNVMLIKALQEQQVIINNLALRLERLQDKKKQLKENA